MGSEMKNFIIYLRVSTKMQGESGLGLEAQRKICESYINSVGGTVINEFVDVESGTSRTRKGLWNAIDEAKGNNATLIVAKLDRLARDIEFVFKVVNTGVDIHFVDMPVVNTMILGVFASVAQYERELISSRTKAALKAKRDRGESMCGDDDCWGSGKSKETGVPVSEIRRNAVHTAASVSGAARTERARNSEINMFVHSYLKVRKGELNTRSDYKELADELNKMGKTTASGKPFDYQRAKDVVKTVKKIYAE